MPISYEHGKNLLIELLSVKLDYRSKEPRIISIVVELFHYQSGCDEVELFC